MEQKFPHIFLFVLLSSALLWSCDQGDGSVIRPVISSISPETGSPGTTVTIQGAGFSNNASENIVKFNGMVATVSMATTNQLIVDVSAGSTTGVMTVEVHSNLATGPVFTVISSSCRITFIKITNSQNNVVITHEFLYDEEGHITEMFHNNGSVTNKRSITYQNAKPYILYVIPQPGDLWIQKHEVTRYPGGTLKDISSINNYAGATATTTSFTKYTLTTTSKQGSEIEMQTSLFSWDINGDMIRFVGEEESNISSKGTYYTYFTDKEYVPQTLDPFARSLSTYQGFDYIWMFGAPAYNTPHLVKTQTTEFSETTYMYEFDSDGKIMKITLSSDTGAKSYMTLTYACL